MPKKSLDEIFKKSSGESGSEGRKPLGEIFNARATSAPTQEKASVKKDFSSINKNSADLVKGFVKGAAETATSAYRSVGRVAETKKRLSALSELQESMSVNDEVMRRIEQVIKTLPKSDPKRKELEAVLKDSMADRQNISQREIGELENAPSQFNVPEILKPKNKAQEIGKTVERVAEFFAGGKPNFSQGIIKSSLKEGGKAATITSGQTEGNLKKAATAGVLGAGVSATLGGALTPLTLKVFPNLAKNLQKTTLRLTPTQKRVLGQKADEVADYLVKEKYVGTPAMRVAKIEKTYEETEEVIQNFLKKDAKDIVISKQKLLDDVEAIKGQFVNDRDLLAVERQIDEFKNLLNGKYPDQIPVWQLNELKRSTYQGAYNKAGEKVLDTVEHSIGDALYKGIKDSVSGLKINGQSFAEFNKMYGTIINARKLLRTAQSRNQAGVSERVLLSILGGVIGSTGGPVSGVLGGVAGNKVVSGLATPIRTMISSAFKSLSEKQIQDIPPAILRIIFGILNSKDESNKKKSLDEIFGR